jgi:hypothetical protein
MYRLAPLVDQVGMKWSLLEIRRLRAHYRFGDSRLVSRTGFSRAVQASLIFDRFFG